MLVDQADTPLFLGAIHRVLLGISLDGARPGLPHLGSASPPSPPPVRSRRSPRTPWWPLTGRSWATIRLALPADRAAVEVLHDDLLPALGLTDRRIGFHHSVDEALSRIRAVRGVAVLMPAPEFDLVVGVARAGRLLPEKATSFQPKPSIGVLIRSLRDE